jgi:hypothetical protein
VLYEVGAAQNCARILTAYGGMTTASVPLGQYWVIHESWLLTPVIHTATGKLPFSSIADPVWGRRLRATHQAFGNWVVAALVTDATP